MDVRLLRLDEQRLGTFDRMAIDSKFEQIKGELGVVGEAGRQQLDNGTNQEALDKGC